MPYINIWGVEERVERWGIRFDRNVRDVAAFYDDDLGGEPDFRHQNIQRQRECMTMGLCQVCARGVPWSDRSLVLSSVSVERVELYGRRVDVVTEPWLCPDCAEFATTVCPALIRRTSADDLTLVSVIGPDRCHLIVSTGYIDGPHEAATRKNNVAMWVKLTIGAQP